MDASPIITNCNISANTGGQAGAILCFSNTSPTIINCLISGNMSGHTGGIRCFSDSSLTITNCTLTGNAGESGGAILSLSSSFPIVTNCILWGDIPNEIASDSTPVVSFSDVEGGWPGNMNMDSDPSFMDPAGGDYHLRADSPCIDAGDNGAAPLQETDMEGNPRIIGDTVDMGAYEYGLPVPTISANGSKGTITVSTSDTVAISIGLDSGYKAGQNADWWMVEATHSGDVKYFNLSTTSMEEGLLPTYQGALFSFGDTPLFSLSDLSLGSHVFCFGVDLNTDSSLGDRLSIL